MRSRRRVLDVFDWSEAITTSSVITFVAFVVNRNTHDGKEQPSQTLVEASDQQVLHRRLTLYVPDLPLDVACWIAYHLCDLQEQRSLGCPGGAGA